MMMRPRNYSVLNRSIARGVSYALRDNNRKKYVNRSTNTNPKQNINNSDINIFPLIMSIVIVLWFFITINS